jgi:hypothetical protein
MATMMNYFIGIFILLGLIWLLERCLEISTSNLKNIFNSNVSIAEKLQAELWQVNRINLRQSTTFEPTEYKFFTNIFTYLLKAHRQLGIDIIPSLNNLKNSLVRDINFEKKLLKIKKQSFLEIGIIFLFSLLIIASARSLVNVEIPLVNILGITLWQIIGCLLLHFFIQHKQEKIFKELFILLKSIYQFHALSNTSISVNQLVERIDFNQVIKLKKHEHLIGLYKKVINDLKHYGVLDASHVTELLHCVNNEYTINFDHFQKQVKAIKLLIIMLFSVLGYLFTMYSMMQAMII